MHHLPPAFICVADSPPDPHLPCLDSKGAQGHRRRRPPGSDSGHPSPPRELRLPTLLDQGLQARLPFPAPNRLLDAGQIRLEDPRPCQPSPKRATSELYATTKRPAPTFPHPPRHRRGSSRSRLSSLILCLLLPSDGQAWASSPGHGRSVSYPHLLTLHPVVSRRPPCRPAKAPRAATARPTRHRAYLAPPHPNPVPPCPVVSLPAYPMIAP